MDVNQDKEELGEFSGEVEGTKRHSQELDVRCPQFLSDMDCGTPAGVNLILTLTSAVLFTSDVTVAIESDGGSKSIDVQRAVVIVLIEPGLRERQDRCISVFMQVIYISLEFVCFVP